MGTAKSYQPEGLQVSVDRVVYQRVNDESGEGREHLFVYFITITNRGSRTCTLLGRKWVLDHADGRTEVIEGDRIVGAVPVLKPGQKFAYNSFHATRDSCRASGAFHGADDEGAPIHVRIPAFEMEIPEADA